MADIEFDEPELAFSRVRSRPEHTRLAGYVIRLGLARDAAGAQKVLLGVIVLAVILGLLGHAVLSPKKAATARTPASENFIPGP